MDKPKRKKLDDADLEVVSGGVIDLAEQPERRPDNEAEAAKNEGVDFRPADVRSDG